MGDLLNIASEDFWLGMGGGFIATGYLTQVFKFLLEKIKKNPLGEKWKLVIALPSAFIVAMLIQLAIVFRYNSSLLIEATPMSFSWGMVGALSVVYAAASAYVYRFFIKKMDVEPAVDK